MNLNRTKRLIDQAIQKFSLDLSGLTVLTEAATGYYVLTPIIAALARTDCVLALTRDSEYGKAVDIRKHTMELARNWKVDDKIQVIDDRDDERIANADIITNLGFVRPIDAEFLKRVKKTAVIPLMWETWEFREADLDLGACRDHGILVMGTDEEKAPLAMYGYSGFMAMKLLFELGLEGYRTKVLLLGGKKGLGFSIYNHFKQVGIEITWFADSETGSNPYTQLASHFLENGAEYDGIIVAEHADNVLLLGEDGLLTYKQLKETNPAICIGVIAGNLDIEGLKNSGLSFFPREIYPFGYMSYQPYNLGPGPVLELFSAGLKVGAVMARCRLQGMNVEETKQYAIKNSLAMDF